MLLIGPPGSGKTTLLLHSVERAVRAHRSAEVQLLVPTTSMKNHLLDVLARRGLMVPSQVVKTMSEFVREATPHLREATRAIEERLLRGAIERAAPRDLGSTAGSVGMRKHIASLIREFWAAGADNLQLESLTRNPRQRAFQEVFRAYEESLAASGFVHLNQRIAHAAAGIRRSGLDSIKTVFIDGFDRFTTQQVELLRALEEQAEEILIAMPDELARYPLKQVGAQHLPGPESSSCEAETVCAASPRAEVLEIARSILASGRPFHEHGIVLRSPEHYEPILREVFETLQIPYRVWARDTLGDHGVVRHCVQWLRAIEGQFPAELTLEALTSPLSPVGNTPQADAFDFEVRERLPNEGLEFLRRCARRSPTVSEFLGRLQPQEIWRRQRCSADHWSQECLKLQAQLQRLPVPAEGGSFQRACHWRAAIRVRQALRKAIEDTAALPEFKADRHISLGTFTDALEDVVRCTALSLWDNRYEVVHVLPVLEARQWSLPIVFVCGLAEGWFPRHFSRDSVFDDEDRRHLGSRGLDLRTSMDRTRDERFLFRVATTRARERMVLSFPLHDHLGKPLLKSSLLEHSTEPRRAPRSRLGDPLGSTAAPRVGVLPADLRGAVADLNAAFSVSGITNFRQCPYLYFANNSLRLRGRPALPDQRLDNARLGTIVHEALYRWNRTHEPIAAVLDRVFEATLGKLNVRESFRTEQLRRAMRADLERFAGARATLEPVLQSARSYFENERQYHLSELGSMRAIHCRIDRYDVDDQQRCFVTDYKYARKPRIKEMLAEHLRGEQLQLMLYLAALEQELQCEPAGMLLCGLRGETSLEGVTAVPTDGLQDIAPESLQSLLETARAGAAQAVSEVLQGSIAVEPMDREYCSRFCDYGSVCRIRWAESDNPKGPCGEEPTCG